MCSRQSRRLGRALIVAFVAVAGAITFGGTARGDATKCKAAIIKAAAGVVQAKATALQKCEERVVRGKLPLGTDCHADTTSGPAIARASTRLYRTIVKACAGKDKTCGTGDAGEPTLAEIGWNIGSCPNFENGNCTNSINDCRDIATCLGCISEAAVDQAIALYYAALTHTDPRTQRNLNKCQAAIGKAAAKFLSAKSRVLANCWVAVNRGKATPPCPAPGDGKAQAAIAAASSKRDATIKKACQGRDKTLGTADDFTPAEIGFPSDCLDATVPTCARSVTTLEDLIACVGCVTDFKVDCVDRAAIPAFVDPYPAQCNPVAPTSTVTSTFTPTPTSTPTPPTTVPGKPITGTMLLIRDSPDATRRKIVFRSNDPQIDTTLVTGIDPVADGAFLQVFDTAGTGESVCLSLPSAAGTWQMTGAVPNVKYIYRDPGFANGPCRLASIKDGSVLRVTCLARVQPIDYALNAATQGRIAVRFTSGTTTYCTVFGGTITTDSGTDPPNAGGKGKFLAKDAPAPAVCPVPPGACP